MDRTNEIILLDPIAIEKKNDQELIVTSVTDYNITAPGTLGYNSISITLRLACWHDSPTTEMDEVWFEEYHSFPNLKDTPLNQSLVILSPLL